LQSLISFPSLTGNELEIQQFIRKKLEEMKLKIDMWEPDIEELKKHPAYISTGKNYKDRPNLVGIYENEEGKQGKSLLFNSHVDVIPAGPIDSWKYSPWSGEIKGNR